MKHTAKWIINYFSKGELLLWGISTIFIIASFEIFDREQYLTLTAGLIGVTSLMFCAKGNPFGQFLMIVFSILYGIISYGYAYYGEMLTYLGMTGPMAVFSMISWLKNPYEKNKAEVKVNLLSGAEITFAFILSAVVTFIFYFILTYFNTSNIIPSTISVTTSFLAVYLTFRRSEFYALGYAANDIVLIILWTLAAIDNRSYISVVICFIIFFANDLYGYINWRRIKAKQQPA